MNDYKKYADEIKKTLVGMYNANVKDEEMQVLENVLITNKFNERLKNELIKKIYELIQVNRPNIAEIKNMIIEIKNNAEALPYDHMTHKEEQAQWARDLLDDFKKYPEGYENIIAVGTGEIKIGYSKEDIAIKTPELLKIVGGNNE